MRRHGAALPDMVRPLLGFQTVTLGSRGARNERSRKEAPRPTVRVGSELGPWNDSKVGRSYEPTEPGEEGIGWSTRDMLTAPNEVGRAASSRWDFAMPRVSM